MVEAASFMAKAGRTSINKTGIRMFKLLDMNGGE
jgi:hypothetical protein